MSYNVEVYNPIVSFLIINLTLAINLYIHIKRWKEKVEVNHFKSAALRSIGFIAAVICLSFSGWLVTVSGTCFYIAYFWLMFDGLYNKLRQFISGLIYSFWQIGTVEKDEAKTDDLLRKLTPLQHKVLKIGLVIISLTLFIIAL